MTMADHRSIGDVLRLLQDDFPDVTISKIRFLEAQGLIEPERTPSGYRKFAQADIDKLTWILTQQRDHFLPLKVIRQRVEAGDHLRAPVEMAPEPPPESPEPVPATTQISVSRTNDPIHSTPLSPDLTSVSLSSEELASASGLTPLQLRDLETYGLLRARRLGPTTYYDGEALLVARVAKEFGAHGVEARHLRMFRTAAEREASVFEQAIMPVIQQRRPEARTEARQQLERMAVLGERLRSAMMRAALAEYLGERPEHRGSSG